MSILDELISMASDAWRWLILPVHWGLIIASILSLIQGKEGLAVILAMIAYSSIATAIYNSRSGRDQDQR